MIDLPFELEPLGATFQSRFWPVSAKQISEIEQVIGWALPEDYKRLLAAYGVAAPVGVMSVELASPDAPSVLFDVFYGAPSAEDSEYSVVERAGQYVDVSGWLVIGDGNSGNVQFYLDSEGVVHAEFGFGRVYQAAPSFSDFLSRFENYDLSSEGRQSGRLTLDEVKAKAAELLKVHVATFDNSTKYFSEIHAHYLWEERRGGRALVVGHDGSVLFADSSVRPSDHRREFADGRRTPLEQFEEL